MSRSRIVRSHDADALGGGGLDPVSEEPLILPLDRGEPGPEPERAGVEPAEPSLAVDPVPAEPSDATPDETPSPRSGREQALLSAVLERELALALAGRPLVPGAANQLVRLWRDEFVVTEHEAGRFRVGTADGQPLAQAVDAWLSRPEYAHFSRATARGGTAAPGGTRTDPVGGSSPPRTLGEALLQQWQQATSGLQGGLGPGLRRPR